jgi:saccharopine dehydrogenase-like NADP-dependent oxidoreductase
MTKVLILGAYGQIARVATDLFLRNTDAELTLYLRNSRRLEALADNPRVRIVEGDVLERSDSTARPANPSARSCAR